jgi:hypothetical protein
MDEIALQSHIRLAVSEHLGGVVWRNNVGACQDKTGRVIRYGLCNESAALNERIKSSDLIGIVPTVIQPHHVGHRIGVFTAIECKKPGWHQTPGDKRAAAQGAYHDIVRSHGGRAGFAASVDDVWRLLS